MAERRAFQSSGLLLRVQALTSRCYGSIDKKIKPTMSLFLHVCLSFHTSVAFVCPVAC